uniref:ZP domain-containing protein n=1 Tax=Panagrolaimus superbus TaxID=310955 RepID=A0A914YYW5_9BILA
MQLHILLEKPLSHSSRIFVKEQSADPSCVHRYEPNSEHNALMFRVPLSTCGMQRIQYHSTKFSFTTSIVVSFHQFFVSSYDRSFRITCDYANIQQPPKHDVTVGVGVEEESDDEFENVNEVYPETADCSYRLLYRNKSSTEMEKAKTVQIGDELEHIWTCSNLGSNQFIFVHDCFVNPEFSLGNDPPLIDSNGCPVDETGIGEIKYSSDGKTATSKHLAYKFADYPNLLFKCSVTICKAYNCKFTDGTSVTLPLNCAQKRSPRSTNYHLPQNYSIELSEIVNVEDILTHEALDRKDSRSQILPSICPSIVIQAALLSFSFIFLIFSIFFVFKSRKN